VSRRHAPLTAIGLLVAVLIACAGPAGRSPASSAAAPPGAAPAAGPGARTPERVVVGLPATSTIFLPHKLAELRGLYLAYGLDAEVMVMKSEAVVAAIASGEVDFSGQFATAIRQRLAGIPIMAVGAVISRSTRQLVAQRQYNSVAELKGKVVVGSSAGGTDTYVMKHLLRFYGLDPDRDVSMLNAGDMPARWAAIQSGRADAAVFTVGDVVQAKDLGLKILAQAADVVDIPENGVAVADGKLADRPDQVKAMLNAMIDAIAYIAQEPRDSAHVLAEWIGVEESQALLQIEAMLPSFSPDLTVSDEGLRQTIDAEKSAAGITRDVPPDEVASFGLLQEVLRERAARR
jgi:NitT/TauT family transport system substrate-binding protein